MTELSGTIAFVFIFYVLAMLGIGMWAAQFTAIGKTFDAIFAIPHIISISVGGAIVLVYTMMGGVRALAWTDFGQGIIMVF